MIVYPSVTLALMTLVESRRVSLPSPSSFKMEERKRPAVNDHEDSGPPQKRHAATVNGTGRAHPDADMPWQDDLEVSIFNFFEGDTNNAET